MTWFKYPIVKPTTYERGGWDGTRSPLLVLVTKNKDFHVGRMYEGTAECFYGVPNRLFCIARVITSAFYGF